MYCISSTGGLYSLNVPANFFQQADTVTTAADYGLRPMPDAAAFPQDAGYQGPATTVTNKGVAGPSLSYIATLTASPGGKFSGLTVGPPDVAANGVDAYADMLFATDSNGVLYALSPTGALQPVFLDGATSMQLKDNISDNHTVSSAYTIGGVATEEIPLTGVTGIAFSNIDYNLWHETTRRGNDPGNAIDNTSDFSRPTQEGFPTTNNPSLYFGLEDPRAGRRKSCSLAPRTTSTTTPACSTPTTCRAAATAR